MARPAAAGRGEALSVPLVPRKRGPSSSAPNTRPGSCEGMPYAGMSERFRRFRTVPAAAPAYIVAMAAIDEIIENFSVLDDWDDRYRYVIELGRTLAPLPEAARNETNKVQGCASQVWLDTRIEAGRRGRADALLRRRQRRAYRARADRDPARALFGQAGARNPRHRRGRAVRTARPARAPHAAALERLPLDGGAHQVGCARALALRA